MVEAELLEEQRAEIEVGDFVCGADVVGLTNYTFVEDGVEGIGCVAGIEISASMFSVTMNEQLTAAVKEAGEFGDDLFLGC